MIRERKFLIVFLVALALGVSNLRAEIITIHLTAEVDYVDDRYGTLQGRIEAGDVMTGSYTYNSDTPDTHTSFRIGDYDHYSPPYGIRLAAGGLVFQTDPDDVWFHIEIVNDYYGDTYLVRSYNNLPIYDDVVIDSIDWQLDDDSGTALSTAALPRTPPVLEDYPDSPGIMIDGYIFRPYPPHVPWKFYIKATVTSAIPEPATLLLLALGSLAMLRYPRA